MEKSTAIIRQDAYQTKISASSHSFIVDEPEDMGGKDLGPSPTELLASALASCTAITLKMYSQRKEWNLEEIKVEVNFERDNSSNTSNFHRSIHIIGNITDEQKNRLLTIANSCPVHKILSGTCNIQSFID
jgi:putative redox protein